MNNIAGMLNKHGHGTLLFGVAPDGTTGIRVDFSGSEKPYSCYATYSMTFKPKAKAGLMTAGRTSCFHDGTPLVFFMDLILFRS